MDWLQLSLADDMDPERFAAELHERHCSVADSWTRSLANGFSPDHETHPYILTAGQLEDHRDRAGSVLSTLQGALAPSVLALTQRGYSVLFADPAGVVVQRYEGRDFGTFAERVSLMPGASWNEASRGTNAIGTAIAERRPVMVAGHAHLDRTNRELVCYAAPIRDPWGQLVGVLDATSYVRRADPLVGAAVYAAAYAVEEALQLQQLKAKGPALAIRLIGRLHEPALIVSGNGQVTHANNAAIAAGITSGSPIELSAGVGRFRIPISQFLPVAMDELEAAANGQIRLAGFDVEDIIGSNGRRVAYLLIAAQIPTTRSTAPPSDAFRPIFGDDPILTAVKRRAAKIAPSHLPALLTGETGTGKELFARAIHQASTRCTGSFVALNCGAIAPSVIHAELFGYAPHSFTGADAKGRSGFLAEANGGTLFLDEVADMPSPLQALFLRFLESGHYNRVGEVALCTSDVRVIAATSQDLHARMADGRFRADLYYRLCGVDLALPPLRNRTDIDSLADYLLSGLARDLGRTPVPSLSLHAKSVLSSAEWPGNIRQLRSALHHALVMSKNDLVVQAWHLPATPAQINTPMVEPPTLPLADTQATALRCALNACDGNVSAAARHLGVARSTVYRMANRHGIEL
jgi:transcriptional regulator of acetoin/glycerol metabolism